MHLYQGLLRRLCGRNVHVLMRCRLNRNQQLQHLKNGRVHGFRRFGIRASNQHLVLLKYRVHVNLQRR